MAKYKVLERSFLNGRIHEPGEIVEHHFTDGGKHGPNLEPSDVELPEPFRAKPLAAPIPPATGARPRGKKAPAPPATGEKPDADDQGAEGDTSDDLA